MKPHEHGWAKLWWHFGPYGPQDKHVHDCYEGKCRRTLIGEGRDCRKGAAHVEVQLPLTPKRERDLATSLSGNGDSTGRSE